VINVDGHPAYASAIAELKRSGELRRRCRCRTAPYLNNVIEQDHRFIQKRITAGIGFRSAEGAWRMIAGYEAPHAIRKDQVRWVTKGDSAAQRKFIHTVFGSWCRSYGAAHTVACLLSPICNRTPDDCCDSWGDRSFDAAGHRLKGPGQFFGFRSSF
jgi:hypothetical protein